MTDATKDTSAAGDIEPPPLVAAAEGENEPMDEEQMLLQQALALSMADGAGENDAVMGDAGDSMDAELAAGEVFLLVVIFSLR